jgi:hypothetical protein
MNEIRYTLITDGSSDRALIPILTWLLRDIGVNIPIQSEWANLGRLRNPPNKLEDKILRSVEIYPCDILFVHRDAERQPRENRVSEIHKAKSLLKDTISLPIVCVIPIKMTEAWLLFDEIAIRKVAGNPKGKQELNLPKVTRIEKITDAKAKLKEIIINASSDHCRRRQDENIPIFRLAEMIENFEPLRGLTAFQELEKELKNILLSQQWI